MMITVTKEVYRRKEVLFGVCSDLGPAVGAGVFTLRRGAFELEFSLGDLSVVLLELEKRA